MNRDLQQQAQKVLLDNWRDGYTIPTAQLYPFQWNWDSGFIAIGYLHFDPAKAIQEFASLFSGQWSNGFLPHILFHKEIKDRYFPNADFWGSQAIAEAPKQLKTSGITQPPVHGFVLEKILNLAADYLPKDFARTYYQKVYLHHRYFYENRDPHQEGLVYINHPWESGRDNSPIWNEVYKKWSLAPEEVPPYQRVDNKLANPEERPTQDDYDRYVYLVDLAKKVAYKDQDIYAQTPFAVQDTLFNAILIRSNESLIRIGKALGENVEELEIWQAKAIQTFKEKMWDEDLGIFTPYDLINQQAISMREIGGLLPLFANIPNQTQAQQLVGTLDSPAFQVAAPDESYQCPTFDATHPSFEGHKYWRGPIWVNTNWMLHQGLEQYNFLEKALKIKSDTLEILSRLGFYEYFDANKAILKDQKVGYGGNAFSWSASLFLDLTND